MQIHKSKLKKKKIFWLNSWRLLRNIWHLNNLISKLRFIWKNLFQQRSISFSQTNTFLTQSKSTLCCLKIWSKSWRCSDQAATSSGIPSLNPRMATQMHLILSKKKESFKQSSKVSRFMTNKALGLMTETRSLKYSLPKVYMILLRVKWRLSQVKLTQLKLIKWVCSILISLLNSSNLSQNLEEKLLLKFNPRFYKIGSLLTIFIQLL